MYRAGIEQILGLRRLGGTMHLKPCIPCDWPGLTITLRLGEGEYRIVVDRFADGQQPRCILDEAALVVVDGAVAWQLAPGLHALNLTI